MERIGPLLEWAPYILAAFPCLPLLVQAQVKVDLAMVSTPDEPETAALMAFQGPVQVAHCASDRPAMQELQNTLPPACKGLHIIDLLEVLSLEDVQTWSPGFTWLYQKDWRYTLVKPTGYTKWFKKETRIQIHTSGRFGTENLLHLEGNTYRVVRDGLFSVIPEAGCSLFLGEEY